MPASAVRIVEVGPRDGLQNIKEPIPTATKVELIQRLERTGLRTIELTSIVSPRAIPQLSDCQDVLSNRSVERLQADPDRQFPVLVPNLKGLDIAIRCRVREVAVFVSATEGFSRANINCSVQEGIQRARCVAEKAAQYGIAVRGYISCIFADPYGGPTEPTAVLHCAHSLLGMGCYEVSLGDTLGVGTPSKVHNLVTYLLENNIPINQLAGHFHDTYGQGASNVWQAYQCGMRVFDSSVSGLGGCPFAPGAKGNVATEDLVYMFDNAGVETGVDLSELIETGTWISERLSRKDASRVQKEICANERLSTTLRHVASERSLGNAPILC